MNKQKTVPKLWDETDKQQQQIKDLNIKADSKLNRDGDTLTGVLNTLSNQYLTNGKYALDLQNSTIAGINTLAFNDTADDPSEGILFPKQGKSGKSTNMNDYDSIWANNGNLKFNQNNVWHTGNFDPNSKMPLSGSSTKNGNLTVRGELHSSGSIVCPNIIINGWKLTITG